MLTTCDTEKTQDKPGEVRLTDSAIEGSNSIRLFLDLLYGHTLPLPDSSHRKFNNVGFLIRKYNCPAAEQAWRYILRAWANDVKAHSVTTFIAAANFGDIKACTDVLKPVLWGESHGASVDDPNPLKSQYANVPKILRQGVIGAHCFDVAAISWSYFSSIPPVYALALLRATRAGGDCAWNDKKFDKIAAEFDKIMKELVFIFQTKSRKKTDIT